MSLCSYVTTAAQASQCHRHPCSSSSVLFVLLLLPLTAHFQLNSQSQLFKKINQVMSLSCFKLTKMVSHYTWSTIQISHYVACRAPYNCLLVCTSYNATSSHAAPPFTRCAPPHWLSFECAWTVWDLFTCYLLCLELSSSRRSLRFSVSLQWCLTWPTPALFIESLPLPFFRVLTII